MRMMLMSAAAATMLSLGAVQAVTPATGGNQAVAAMPQSTMSHAILATLASRADMPSVTRLQLADADGAGADTVSNRRHI